MAKPVLLCKLGTFYFEQGIVVSNKLPTEIKITMMHFTKFIDSK